MAEKPTQEKLRVMSDLLQELMPEELEPRLELQVFIDPLSSLAAEADTNNNNNNNNNDGPVG